MSRGGSWASPWGPGSGEGHSHFVKAGRSAQELQTGLRCLERRFRHGAKRRVKITPPEDAANYPEPEAAMPPGPGQVARPTLGPWTCVSPPIDLDRCPVRSRRQFAWGVPLSPVLPTAAASQKHLPSPQPAPALMVWSLAWVPSWHHLDTQGLVCPPRAFFLELGGHWV